MNIPLVNIHCLGFLTADEYLWRLKTSEVGQAEIPNIAYKKQVLRVLPIYFERVLLHGVARC